VFQPLPAPVVSALAAAPAVGFSGSRSVVSPWVAPALAAVPWSVPVFVGCAGGVDAAVRSARACRVFWARLFGCGRGSFAARSVAFVRALAGSGGLLLSFPSGPCPAAVVPSPRSSVCFCGAGSGSWASLAFAVGSGVPVLVALPPGVAAPSWLAPLCPGWWVAAPAPAVQLALL